MSSIKATAEQFFDACETGKGWDACQAYCHEGATFSSQTGALEGIETIHDLRREFPEVKIIAMSGRDPRMKFDVFEVARQIGAVRTFKKPFKFEELVAAVRELTAETKKPGTLSSPGFSA